MTNKLFYGDNLDVLREHIADESVDLTGVRSIDLVRTIGRIAK